MTTTTKFNGLDTYEFPTFVYEFDNGAIKAFPSLKDYDSDDEVATINPVIQLIKDGHPIELVVVGSDWIDDHEPCYNVTVVVDGKKYGFSMWCITRESVKMLYQAEGGIQSAINRLTEYITAH